MERLYRSRKCNVDVGVVDRWMWIEGDVTEGNVGDVMEGGGYGQ